MRPWYCKCVLHPQPNVRAPLTHGMLAMLASPSPNAPLVFLSFSLSYITYTSFSFSFFTLIQANACDASELHLTVELPQHHYGANLETWPLPICRQSCIDENFLVREIPSLFWHFQRVFRKASVSAFRPGKYDAISI